MVSLIKLRQKIFLKLAETVLPEGYYIQSYPVFLADATTNQSLLAAGDLQAEIGKFNRSLYGNRYAPMRDMNRWLLLTMMLNKVSLLACGDYAELGTYEGASARVIYRYMRSGSALYCFDTFSGFDRKDIQQEMSLTGIVPSELDFSDTTMQLAKTKIVDGEESKKLILRKGYFPETFLGLDDVHWRFVHLDCDLYAPTLEGLNSFWPNLVPGGVVILHDYSSAYSGVKKAVDEFSAKLNVPVFPFIDKSGSAVIIKSEQ